MKIPFLSILFMFLSYFVKGQHVNFYNGSLEQAKQKSIEQSKPLMIYIGATWCGYCKYTENEIFNRDTAYDFLNAQYICFKLDEKAKEAKLLKVEYDIEVLPAYFFYDAAGSYVSHFDGFLNAAQLKAESQKGMKKRKKFF